MKSYTVMLAWKSDTRDPFVMANIDRGIVTWSGVPTGPGYSVFYAVPGHSVMTALRAFFNSLGPSVPAGITFKFPSSGDTIDSATGDLVGSWSGSVLSDVVCSATGGYSAASGLAVGWDTGTLVAAGGSWKTAHRVRGRTFLVPLGDVCYDSAGTPIATTLTALNTWLTTLLAATTPNLVIWAAPKKGNSDGVLAPVTGFRVKDQVAILRSRRN